MKLSQKNDTKMSEKHLIEKIHKNKIFFSQLYEKYIDQTYGFVYSKVQNKELTEDLISEAWFKILRKVETFHPEQDYQVTVWIFRIVRNHMYDYFKKGKNIVLENSQEILEYIEDKGEDIKTQIDNEFTKKIIIEHIQHLSQQQREVIELKYFSDMKNNEISEILGIKEKSVSATLTKALHKLKILLDGKIYIN